MPTHSGFLVLFFVLLGATFVPARVFAADAAPDLPRFAWMAEDGVRVRAGAEERTIPDTADVSTFAWDRDGAALVATAGGALFRVDVESGARTVLADGFRDVRFPDVASATGRIAYAVREDREGEHWELQICDAEGSNPRRLCAGYDPSFTPDGRLVFEVYAPNARLMAIEPSHPGGRPAPLFDDETARHTVASDATGRLTWSSGGALFLTAGDRTTRISPDEPVYDRFGSVSPDGRWLLFFRSRGERGEAIVARDLERGDEHVIVTDPRHPLASFAPHDPRDLASFRRTSDDRRAEGDVAAQVGLDPRLDFPRALWVERDVAAGEALLLGGVTRLFPGEAAELARFDGSSLILPDLASLDVATAARLGVWGGGELWLDGLGDLSIDALDRLLQQRRSLISLRGLRNLTPALATRLAGLNASLLLDGLPALDAPTARAIAGWEGYGERYTLSLSGLRTIDPEVAALLATSTGWGLALGGLASLEPYVADALAAWRGAALELDGLRELDSATVDRLLRFGAKWIELGGLTTIDPEDRRRLEASESPAFIFPR